VVKMELRGELQGKCYVVDYMSLALWTLMNLLDSVMTSGEVIQQEYAGQSR
jgi:hypothetical protein